MTKMAQTCARLRHLFSFSCNSCFRTTVQISPPLLGFLRPYGQILGDKLTTTPHQPFGMLAQVSGRQVCVTADHFDALPAPHFLQRRQWHAGLNQPAGPGMPQVMEPEIRDPSPAQARAPGGVCIQSHQPPLIGEHEPPVPTELLGNYRAGRVVQRDADRPAGLGLIRVDPRDPPLQVIAIIYDDVVVCLLTARSGRADYFSNVSWSGNTRAGQVSAKRFLKKISHKDIRNGN